MGYTHFVPKSHLAKPKDFHTATGLSLSTTVRQHSYLWAPKKGSGGKHRLISLHPGNNSICTNSLPFPNNWISCLKPFMRGNLLIYDGVWTKPLSVWNGKTVNISHLSWTCLNYYSAKTCQEQIPKQSFKGSPANDMTGEDSTSHSDCTMWKRWHQGEKKGSSA